MMDAKQHQTALKAAPVVIRIRFITPSGGVPLLTKCSLQQVPLQDLSPRTLAKD